MSNKKQVPKRAIDRKNQKQVRSILPTHDGKPVWRFSTVDKGGPFKWPKGEQSELEIVGKLHDFDSMTWSGQNGIVGEKHHLLDAGSLSKEAKQRLEELKLDDEIENLFSFHIQGKPRIIAIRHLHVASLFWYDPEHKVAPSAKKHT